MPLLDTMGNNTADAYQGGIAVVPNYIEDVFSTWLYTGTGALQTITNNINLSSNGGLVWLKSRSTTYNNYLQDTTRGIQNSLVSNDTSAQSVGNDIVDSVSTSGFVVQSYSGGNSSGSTYASWTFRKKSKFFDVVTYTGTGSNTTIAHNLGSVPGCIIVKRTDTTGAWQVYHRSLANTEYLVLNTTAATATGTTRWNSTTPTSTVFSLGTDATVNASGGTYVAYIYAHDSGGFGLTGTDNVISCGSFTSDGSGAATVTLGYEPQWILFKLTSRTGDWVIFDTMRGMSVGVAGKGLYPNLNVAESNNDVISPTSTGFTYSGYASATIIYIAIRRGPMKVPTDATKVFSPVARTGTGASASITGLNFPPDLTFIDDRNGSYFSWFDKLRGAGKMLQVNTGFEASQPTEVTTFGQTGISFGVSTNGWTNYSGEPYINYLLGRAPSFFDEVCYTGTSTFNRTVNHNLGVVPELIIYKNRSSAASWSVQCSSFPSTTNSYASLNSTAAVSTAQAWLTPTTTTFGFGDGFFDDNGVNASGQNYVAYLFATCAGVSKVGSYTGNGSTQAIACGFAGGARFVLIKRTDSTGDWYVYDTARGMSTLTDPYLFLNGSAAETATLGSVTSTTGGFTVNESILTGINTSSATYIFFAVS